MKQVVQDQARGQILVIDCPVPQLDDYRALVRVHRSVISSGTERAKVVLGEKSLLGKARARPQDVAVVREALRREGVRRTFEKVQDRLHALQPLGYSASGVVVDVGRKVENIRVGMRVAISGAGVANHAEYDSVPFQLCTPLPDDVSFDDGAFVTLGSIALQGIRQADVRPGEKCLIVGLGLIGQLTARLLNAYGSPAVGVDPKPDARELAAPALVAAIPEMSDALSRDFDHVLVTASSSDETLLRRVAQYLRDRGTITVVGDVPLVLDRNEFFNGEHQLRISRSYGPGRYDADYEERGRDYPIGYVRWTEGRNFAEIVRLISAGRLHLSSLVECSFSVEDAPAAYEHLKLHPSPLAIALTYPAPDQQLPVSATSSFLPSSRRDHETLGLGIIGAGSYARKFVLPSLARDGRASLQSVVTATGLTAFQLQKKFGIAKLADSPTEIIDDPRVEAVVISTRHDSHGRLVIQALDRGKWVYVDKPLCVTQEERVAIASHPLRDRVVVGFNRRRAPALEKLRSLVANFEGSQLIYRVTPDPAVGHWSLDTDQGGRIVGEACHFVDFAVYLMGTDLKTVYASGPVPASGSPDRLQLQMAWSSGNSAQISYGPSTSMPEEKERIEISTPEWFAEISRDYRRLQFWSGKKRQVHKFASDKGQSALVKGFIEFCLGDKPSPVPFAEADLSTRATFAALTSLVSGESQDL